MIKIPSTELTGPSCERYQEFMEAYGRENIDAGNTTVLNLYNQVREIQGTYLLREITMKQTPRAARTPPAEPRCPA